MLINSFATMPTTLLVSGFDIRHNEICTTEIPLELPACVNTDKMELITVADTNDLLIAPNPSKGITTFSFTNATAPQLAVYDLLGKEIAHYIAIETKGEWQLDTSSIAAGVYLVVMKDANGILMQKKLIVE